MWSGREKSLNAVHRFRKRPVAIFYSSNRMFREETWDKVAEGEIETVGSLRSKLYARLYQKLKLMCLRLQGTF